MESKRDDPFSRVNYRAVIAWPARIEREAPFFRRVMQGIPERSLADLGCGTGEHSRHFAAEGYRVVGLDASESMIASATDQPVPENLRFVHGDLRDAGRLITDRVGAAIILGNMLPFLTEDEDLRRALEAVHEILLPGGRLLFQLLNYEKLYARGERWLPINVRPADAGEIVFLRLLKLLPGGRVLFFPTTLSLDPEDSENPVRLVQTRRVELRGWTRAELLPALAAAGFDQVELFGGMEDTPFEPLASSDLVVAARKSR